MEWNTEWNTEWNMEWGNVEKMMIKACCSTLQTLICQWVANIPDIVTQNSPKKRVLPIRWTGLTLLIIHIPCIDSFSCKQVSSKHDATGTHDK